MPGLRALVFDVFGTLVDWRSSVVAEASDAGRRAGVDAGWAAVVDDWRRAYPPALEEARAEPVWRDLDALQRETLDDVLDRHGVPLPAGEREVLVQSWRRLRPWPDTGAGLDRLRARFATATLSNGQVALLVVLLRFGGWPGGAGLSAAAAGCAPSSPRSGPRRTSPIPPCTCGARSCWAAHRRRSAWWPRTPVI